MAIAGLVEFADASVVSGWAYDSALPSVHLEIVVRLGDQFLASSYADIRREDLIAAGMGDGTHGFKVDLRALATPVSDAADLEVHAVSGAETIKLPHAAQRASGGIDDLTSQAFMPTQDAGQHPIFILGAARSGTSVIALALLESGYFVGTGEGHLMPLAHELLATIDRYYHRPGLGDDPKTLLGKVPVDAFQKLIRRSFVKLAQDLFHVPHWLDKTPTLGMVHAAPLMRELWPNARFIFMKRRVIENILSRQRKFAADTTDRHYSDWAAVMMAWLSVRDKLAGAALEIEHRQLVLDPNAVTSSVVEFLQMPDAPAERFRRYVDENRPEQTDGNFGATYTFDHLGLSENDARQMKTVCDPLMTVYGYSYNESYFSA